MNATDTKLTSSLAQKIRDDAAAAKSNGGCNGIMTRYSDPYKSAKVCGLDGLCAVCTSRNANR
jgi:hypothetical protein